MGFQIRNQEGNAVKIGDLDKEAAEFWEQEIDSKWYAHPQKKTEGESEMNFVMRQGNWFDVIGHVIHSKDYPMYSGWTNVVYHMIADSLAGAFIEHDREDPLSPVQVAQFEDYSHPDGGKQQLHLPENVEMRIYATLEFYRPYIDLINYWKSKGYTPHKVED